MAHICNSRDTIGGMCKDKQILEACWVTRLFKMQSSKCSKMILHQKIKVEKKLMNTSIYQFLNSRYAYMYDYDARNRCIRKKIPGTGWIYYGYDRSDRLDTFTGC